MQPTLITGIGIWSCIGENRQIVEQSLRAGRSGIGTDYRRTEYGYQSPLTGVVPEPDLSHEPLHNSQRRCLAEQSAYAYFAVKEAIAQAGLTPEQLRHAALIVSNDSCAAAASETEEVMALHHDSRRLGGFHVFKSLNSTTSMSLASIFGIGGLSLSLSAACAGGGHAIGLAHFLINAGVIDTAIVVGAQEVGLHSYTAFDALGVFSKNVENPSGASRPFDVHRDGLVPSGGAACVILESRASFSFRLPQVDSPCALAAVVGYGFSTSPNVVSPSSESILAAMKMAMGCHHSSVAAHLSTIFPHATSTRDGDRAEAEAITSLLQSVPDNPLSIYACLGNQLVDPHASYSMNPSEIDGVSSCGGGFIKKPLVIPTKALTGHECWMAGVSQIVYAIIQSQGGFATPHPNLSEKDLTASSLHIPTDLQQYDHTLFLCNAFGFGGTNSSLLLAAPSMIPSLE